MARFVKADVVVIAFPFSDLSASKRRPALVLASLPGNDVILCQITSRTTNLAGAILITAADFKDGGLNRDSSVRPESALHSRFRHYRVPGWRIERRQGA